MTSDDFVSFGVVSTGNIKLNCKRDGSRLKIVGNVTIGTPSSTEARMFLKYKGLRVSPAKMYPFNTKVGEYIRHYSSVNKGGLIYAIDDNLYLRFSSAM